MTKGKFSRQSAVQKNIEKRQRDAGVFDCFAYGEIDTRRTYLLSQTAAPLLQGGQNLAVLIALWDLSVSMPQSDSPYSCPSSSYVSKILLAFLLRYRKQTAFFEHTLQFGSIKLCECTIFFAGKCSHYTGCFTGSHQGGLYAE